MARKNPEVDYNYSLDLLRDIYACSPPHARLNVIDQRIGFKDSLPNNLVTSLSAVEALARSLLVHLDSPSKDHLLATYKKYRLTSPEKLVAQVMFRHGVDRSELSSFFGEDTWELFGYAVGFRNLITHECTYVGQDKAPSMIQACEEVLEKLKLIGGLDSLDTESLDPENEC